MKNKRELDSVAGGMILENRGPIKNIGVLKKPNFEPLVRVKTIQTAQVEDDKPSFSVAVIREKI